MTSAIIVAAGSSRRMGFDKLFAPLNGKPVLAHTIAAFDSCKEIGEIIVVAKADRIEEIRALVAHQKFEKVAKIIPGGAERYLSVWQGLQAVSADAECVAIHDGARPLTTPALIHKCLKLARETGAACCASPIPETVKRASDEGVVTESVERTGLWAMQTPQIFSTPVILQAYAAIVASHEPVTDEVSAVQRIGKKIALLHNDDWNLKITFPRDLEMAQHVLALRREKPRKGKRRAQKDEQAGMTKAE
jgi:2-C-methyl-D-erythritol 4-phosphate cytidylyltransferase